MDDRYRLGGLEDDQLLAALSGLVRRENDSLSDLLAHLAELDERALCVALGFSSLFAYCIEALGFCKSAAGRRIAGARVCREFPEAFARVANGELQLSVLCALRPHLNAENASELFATCARKSYDQVEDLLAARFPKPDVRDLIRRLPGKARATGRRPPPERGDPGAAKAEGTVVGTPDIGTQRIEAESRASQTRQIELARQIERAPRPLLADADQPPAAHAPTAVHATTRQALLSVSESPRGERPLPQAQRGAVKPLSADRFSVNFTADGEFRDLLEEVRALLSHAEPKGDLMRVMKRGLEALRSELLKKRFGVGRKPRTVRSRTNEPPATSQAPAPKMTKRTRHVAATVAREVYVRDHGRCTFCGENGRRCGERRLLQLDHVVPHAQGGEATVANLRLRCSAHNLHTAREDFGRQCVSPAAEPTKRRARRLRFEGQQLNRSAPGQSSGRPTVT